MMGWRCRQERWWWVVVTIMVVGWLWSMWFGYSTSTTHFAPLPASWTNTLLAQNPTQKFGSNSIPKARHNPSRKLTPTTTGENPPNMTHISQSNSKIHLDIGWKNVLMKRQKRVAQVCRQHYNTLKRFNIFQRLTYDTQHHLAYCRNAKVQLVSAYRDKIPENYKKDIQLNMIEKYRIQKENTLPSKSESISELSNSSNQAEVFKSWKMNNTNITYTGNNFPNLKLHERKSFSLLSVNNSTSDNQTLPPTTYPENALDPNVPTFREFVLFVIDQISRCMLDTSYMCLGNIDIHWRPIYDRCAFCDIHYKVIAKMETFDKDERYLSQLVGLPLLPMGPTKLHSSRGSSTNFFTKKYFSTLNKSERKKVYKAFYYDFLLFDYSPNDIDL
ncbi:carbohydrate sulfotransferase 11-like isoform X2 [Homarus americanus]|uniref:carbohydrate sulfotransferase 11-like isoform X2 n=1 Tax=Homarus americanus TaxID=6706 RepID=UPI001C438562|nr:carbohydrate sulfotransferase 11-like isoform X2 [Homarus americanus]